jgi:hypothetical protein
VTGAVAVGTELAHARRRGVHRDTEGAALIGEQRTVVARDPHPPAAVEQAHLEVAPRRAARLQHRRVTARQDREPHPVEADDARPRIEPEVAVGRAQQGRLRGQRSDLTERPDGVVIGAQGERHRAAGARRRAGARPVLRHALRHAVVWP